MHNGCNLTTLHPLSVNSTANHDLYQKFLNPLLQKYDAIILKGDNDIGQTVRQHIQWLLNAGLKIKLSKCLFFKEQIHYLGHLVSGTSILPLANKINVLMKLKPSSNIKEVRYFLGLTGYYSNVYVITWTLCTP